ncbi:MAG: hypothetical protein EZS28_003684 [Streblomastix strix]|uniref:Uncharacterized protein n=1 Tax=Streblomastix strix TaxID=222440 RepID=A0A5J4X2A2_9EUKA|nr:MAG: hypothetical protein EZS28_003684 [Streblomastix strix]
MFKSKDEEHSQTACEGRSKLIRKSPNIQKSLLKSGFIQMTTFALMEEGDLHHVQTNILIVILDLITSGADIHVMGGLLPVLDKLAKEEDSQKQRITMKTQIIQTILTTKLKSGDVAFSIYVPIGSYTKKDGEFTYTSTSAQYKVFPIEPVITEGIYKCEFKGNLGTGNDWFGVMKSGLVVPFGQHTNTQPYAKDSIFFYAGGVQQNLRNTPAGNSTITINGIAAIEVNMNTTPRTVHLFINNVQQPGYMSGLPESVQYYFQLWTMGQPAIVLPLKRLSAPTVTNIYITKEVKWECYDLTYECIHQQIEYNVIQRSKHIYGTYNCTRYNKKKAIN